jgi:hypothetical protein
MKSLAAPFFAVLVASCGGGGSSSTDPGAPCTPFVDSFGQTVTCAALATLAGADLAYLDAGGGGGGGGYSDGYGDGGADGSAGDGAPIANTELRFTDFNGRVVTTRTDATGYYRINLRGLRAPLVAAVVRNNKPWKSMLITTIVRAPANRKFYTINLTGLTDYVASEVARKEGLSSADLLTPRNVANQSAVIPITIAAFNNSLSAQIIAAGLNPSSFSPLTTPFKAVLTDSYDKLLESVVVERNPITGATVVTPLAVVGAPTFSLGGSISGLGNSTGLSLRNGSEALAIAVNATGFTLATKLAQNSSYNITVGTQPSGLSCAVNNGVGTMGSSAVTAVAVVCSPANAIVGAWRDRSATDALITFFADGSMTHSQTVFDEADPIARQVWAGSESGGTYTWNPATGVLTFTCPTTDTNGTSGVSDNYSGGFTGYKGVPIGTCLGASDPRTATIDGNTLTVTSSNGVGTFTRVQ